VQGIPSLYYYCVSYTNQLYVWIWQGWLVGLMVLNATITNISVISWRSVLLVEETGVTEENHRPVASHWQTLSHNVVSITPRLSNVIGTINQYSQLDFHVTKIVILSAFILIYELYIIIIKQISVDNSNTRLIRTKNSRSLRLLQNENSRCLRLLLNEISRFNGLPNYWKLLFYECLHWFY
jgi:hypothetical protein